MYTLYTEIEMPLIYSLYHMEKEGIQVQREKLKEYGDKLKVGIARLEKEYMRIREENLISIPLSSWERFSLVK